MRLINVEDYSMGEFIGRNIPDYAILSHTWGKEEVSFQDIQNLEAAKQKEGFKKIAFCCEQARGDRLKWAWVDTCCVDKTSSAELSEAINSMFQWYSRAMVCYAYLSDVFISYNYTLLAFDFDPIPRSRWFTRGWTLQELIAPLSVEFFSSDWSHIGSKKQLARFISDITGIPETILDHSTPILEETVYQRMHWASRRETTREEDMAYCLLGLFDINLPLLYGEGKKAFYRLQEEIIKHLDDHTIFIWDVFPVKEIPELRLPRVESTLFYAGILAESPRQFRNVCDVRKVNPTRRSEKIQVSQKGSQMNLYLKKATPNRIPTDILYKVQKEGFGFFLAALDCIIGTIEYIAESEGVSIWNEARSAMLLLRRPDGCYEKVLSHYEKVYLDEKPTTWEYSTCFIEGPRWQTSLFNNTKASDIKSDPKKLFFRWSGPSFGYSVIHKFTDNKFAAFLLERSSVSDSPLIIVICSVWQQFGTLGLLDVKFQNNRPERPSEFLRELIVKEYSWQVGVPIRDGLGPVLEKVIHVNGMAFVATLWEDQRVNSSEVSYIKHVFALLFSLRATPQKSVNKALLGAITRSLEVDELPFRSRSFLEQPTSIGSGTMAE